MKIQSLKTYKIIRDECKIEDMRNLRNFKIAMLLRDKFAHTANRKVRFEIQFIAIIASSLGVMLNSAIYNMTKIIGNESKSLVDLWIKRFVIAA